MECQQALNNTAGEELYRSISNCQVSELVFSKSNPDIQDLHAVYQQHKTEQPDLIIAIGGGSVLDMAKSLAAILNEEIFQRGTASGSHCFQGYRNA